MKLFKCSDGSLINPDHVCCLSVDGSISPYRCVVTLVAPFILWLYHEERADAEAELEAFRLHCEGNATYTYFA